MRLPIAINDNIRTDERKVKYLEKGNGALSFEEQKAKA